MYYLNCKYIEEKLLNEDIKSITATIYKENKNYLEYSVVELGVSQAIAICKNGYRTVYLGIHSGLTDWKKSVLYKDIEDTEYAGSLQLVPIQIITILDLIN